jgi:hypothetical protein
MVRSEWVSSDPSSHEGQALTEIINPQCGQPPNLCRRKRCIAIETGKGGTDFLKGDFFDEESD